MKKKGSSDFDSEVELAKAVAGWAESEGWEVFKEVHTSEGAIDLVLKKGSILWAIETKLRLNCEVLQQAYRRLLHVHYVSVATPSKKGDLAFVYEHFLSSFGIGFLEVKHPDNCRIRLEPFKNGHVFTASTDTPVNWEFVVHEEVAAKIQRPHDLSRRKKQNHYRVKLISAMKAFLSEKHKTLIAGAPGGGQWTPFKVTTQNVKDYLKVVGNASLKQIVENVKHHYRKPAHAKAGIYNMMDEIHRSSFERVIVGGETHWRLKSEK